MTFTSSSIPDLAGQVIIVTGANVGLGYETVKQLSSHNPRRIYLACRSVAKAEAAIRSIQTDVPSACSLSPLQLDLASFDSIKAATTAFLNAEDRLDILVNNAGIMMVPEGLTKNGYEIQFGTNAMGTALLTQLLLPTIRDTANKYNNTQARVVIVGSATHAQAPSDAFASDAYLATLKTDMQRIHTTSRYAVSKLADLFYGKALAARVKDVRIVNVHPGWAATNLHHASTGMFLKPFLNAAILFAPSPAKGALSQIWAAVSPEAKSGGYYGPVAKEEAGSKLSQDEERMERCFGYVQGELKGHADIFE